MIQKLTHVKYFEPKSIIFTPIENLQFQQISIKLTDDDPIKQPYKTVTRRQPYKTNIILFTKAIYWRDLNNCEDKTSNMSNKIC